MSHIPAEALIALGERYHMGAVERGYGSWNWAQGIPFENLLQHAMTHLALLGNQISAMGTGVVVRSEDGPRQNAAAVMWNMACIIYFLQNGNSAEPGTVGDE